MEERTVHVFFCHNFAQRQHGRFPLYIAGPYGNCNSITVFVMLVEKTFLSADQITFDSDSNLCAVMELHNILFAYYTGRHSQTISVYRLNRRSASEFPNGNRGLLVTSSILYFKQNYLKVSDVYCGPSPETTVSHSPCRDNVDCNCSTTTADDVDVSLDTSMNREKQYTTNKYVYPRK